MPKHKMGSRSPTGLIDLGLQSEADKWSSIFLVLILLRQGHVSCKAAAMNQPINNYASGMCLMQKSLKVYRHTGVKVIYTISIS